MALGIIDFKESELYRETYLCNPDRGDNSGIPITWEQCNQAEELLRKEYSTHLLGYGNVGCATSASYYLIMGGFVEAGHNSGRRQIRLFHESRSGIQDLVTFLRLPVPVKTPTPEVNLSLVDRHMTP